MYDAAECRHTHKISSWSMNLMFDWSLFVILCPGWSRSRSAAPRTTAAPPSPATTTVTTTTMWLAEHPQYKLSTDYMFHWTRSHFLVPGRPSDGEVAVVLRTRDTYTWLVSPLPAALRSEMLCFHRSLTHGWWSAALLLPSPPAKALCPGARRNFQKSINLMLCLMSTNVFNVHISFGVVM